MEYYYLNIGDLIVQVNQKSACLLIFLGVIVVTEQTGAKVDRRVNASGKAR
jgi:hypothetical protein